MSASMSVSQPFVPGSYWREVLSERVDLAGSRCTVADLLGALAGCDAGLVEVAGWLTDEMGMGRVRAAEDDGLAGFPRSFERMPGVRPYRSER
jgi:hypothetical protein